jgi:serine/threonine protein kinase
MPLVTDSANLSMVGEYDLLEKIADGGMGTVYKARQRSSGQLVAVKIVPPHMAANPVLLKRFEQEFRASSILDHPNIVKALDFGIEGSFPYLVMELVEGESLGQRLDREKRLPEPEAIRIIGQVAQGLHKAHKQGLIHRDVKPDNILITPNGVAKLTDLGLVKEMVADLNLTRTGRGLGTPHFMAPEQFRNAKNADVRCDIYSLAATLYMLVTGELPFKSCGPLDAWLKKVQNEFTPPREINPGLSERIDWAIRRSMSADPAQRPANAREFVEDLTGRSTRKATMMDLPVKPHEFWYLVYRDEEEEIHTVKGTVPAIRRSLKEGLLGDASNVRASRSKQGPFDTLRSYPEFRDLVVAPAPVSIANPKTSPTVTPLPASPLRPSLVKSSPTVVAESKPVPVIDLQDSHASSQEWVRWLFLVLIAAAAAVAGLYFFPR